MKKMTRQARRWIGPLAAGIILFGLSISRAAAVGPSGDYVKSAEYCPKLHINTYEWSPLESSSWYSHDTNGKLYAQCQYGEVPWGGGSLVQPPAGSQGNVMMLNPMPVPVAN